MPLPGNEVVYNVKWQDEFKFIRAGPNKFKARCEDCNSVFSIKKGGRSDITQHVAQRNMKSCIEEQVLMILWLLKTLIYQLMWWIQITIPWIFLLRESYESRNFASFEGC